jgi:hypothetical protein
MFKNIFATNFAFQHGGLDTLATNHFDRLSAAARYSTTVINLL